MENVMLMRGDIMKVQKKWEDLEICDDFMFAKVMRNKDICREVIEKILKIEIEKIEYIEEQKAIDINYDSKSVRLDVYVKDELDTVYNVEIQTTNQYDLSKRSRYYQSMIDLDLIEKGEIYNNLNKSYVMFICTFDPFKQGRHIYTFRNICEQDKSLYLDDETTKVFLNSKGKLEDVDEEVKAFLDYVDGKVSDNSFVKKIDSEVKRVKRNEEWRVEYMTLLMREREIAWQARQEGRLEGRQEGRLEGRKEGRQEGRKEERQESIRNLIELCQEMDMSLQQTAIQVSGRYGLSQQEIKEELKRYWKR